MYHSFEQGMKFSEQANILQMKIAQMQEELMALKMMGFFMSFQTLFDLNPAWQEISFELFPSSALVVREISLVIDTSKVTDWSLYRYGAKDPKTIYVPLTPELMEVLSKETKKKALPAEFLCYQDQPIDNFTSLRALYTDEEYHDFVGYIGRRMMFFEGYIHAGDAISLSRPRLRELLKFYKKGVKMLNLMRFMEESNVLEYNSEDDS